MVLSVGEKFVLVCVDSIQEEYRQEVLNKLAEDREVLLSLKKSNRLSIFRWSKPLIALLATVPRFELSAQVKNTTYASCLKGR
jgi:hypothetical protein